MKKALHRNGWIAQLSITAQILVMLFWPALAMAGPRDGQVTAGSATVRQAGNTTWINQTSDRAVIHWNGGFDINPNEAVNIHMARPSSVQLEEITSGNPTSILGRLVSNGRVFIVNQSGVVFGPRSQVDVAGLVATTLHVSDVDFMNGRMTLEQQATALASVVNHGRIRVSDGGEVFLLAPTVENDGLIVANLGHIALAAGTKYRVDFDGTGLFTYEVDGSAVNTLTQAPATATNNGTLRANGGNIDLKGSVINNGGLIEARSLRSHDGEVRLEGSDPVANTGKTGYAVNYGQVHNADGTVVTDSGRIDVSAADAFASGGKVTITGETITVSGSILAKGQNKANGGSVLIDSTVKTVMTDTSLINVSAPGQGNAGEAVVWSDAENQFFGRIVGTAVTKNGGTAEVSGHTLGFHGLVDLHSVHGTSGTLLLDPTTVTFQAGPGGTLNGELPDTTGGADVGGDTLDVSAVNAALAGGSVIVSATQSINASPGAGTITWGVAANSLTITTSNGAAAGSIDLTNLTINATAASNIFIQGSTSATFACPVTTSNISTAGGTVVVTTENGGVTINAPLSVSGGSVNVVDFNPGGSITIAAAGSVTSGGGTIAYQADNFTLAGGAGQTNAGAGRVKFQTTNNAIAFNLAGGAAPTLNGAALTTVSAGTLQIGSNLNTGGITFTGPFTASSWGTLSLNTGGSISQAGGADILTDIGGAVLFSSGTGVAMATGANAVSFGPIAGGASTSGGFAFSNAGAFTVGTADGVSGITTTANNTIALTGAGQITIAGVNLNAVGGTSTVTVTGAVSLTTGAVVVTSGSGGTSFSSTIDGGQALSVNDLTGTVTFTGNIGATTNLTSLNVSGTTINVPGVVNTNGAAGQQYIASTSVALGGATVLTATGGGPVSFLAGTPITNAAAQALTISDVGGTTTFSGAVGTGGNPLASLSVTAATIDMNGGNVFTNGAAGQVYTTTSASGVALGASLILTATGGGPVDFTAGTVITNAAPQALNVSDVGGTTTFSGSVGSGSGVTALSSVTVNAGVVVVGAGMTTAGNGLISLTSGVGAITIDSPEGASAATVQSGTTLTLNSATALTIGANAGTVTQVISGTTMSVTVGGGALTVGTDDLLSATTGNLTISAQSVSAGTITATAGNLSLTSTVGGIVAGSLNASGSVTLSSATTILNTNNPAATNVTGTSLSATANGAAGVLNPAIQLNTNVGTLTLASSTASGFISIVNTGALAVTNANTANGAITLTATTGGLTINAPGVSAGGGAAAGVVNLNAFGVNQLLTISGGASVTGTGPITYTADNMSLVGTTNAGAGTQRVILQQNTAATVIDLGAADAPGILGLTNAELGTITANVLQVGNFADTGGIRVNAAISAPAGWNTLSLFTGGTILEVVGGLTVPNLHLNSVGAETLTNANNVGTLSVNVTGAGNALQFTEVPATTLTVGTVDGVVGVNTNDGNVTLSSDSLTLTNNITVSNAPSNALNQAVPPSSLVWLQPVTAGQTINLGGPKVGGTLSLTAAELNNVREFTGALAPTGILRIGNTTSGNVNVTASIAPANVTGLSLIAGTGGPLGTITENAGATITIRDLALQSFGAITALQANAVQNFAAHVTGAGNAVSFTNANALTVTEVDNVEGIQTNNGDISVTTTAGNLTVQYAAGEALLVGRCYVDAGTGTLSLTASGAGASVVVVPPANVCGNSVVVSSATDININSASGAITAPVSVTLNAGTGGVFGRIIGNQGLAADVVTQTLTAIALGPNGANPGPGIDLNTTITTLARASVTGNAGFPGLIAIRNTQAMTVNQANTVNGAILLSAQGGNLSLLEPTLVSPNNGVFATTGEVVLETLGSGDIVLGDGSPGLRGFSAINPTATVQATGGSSVTLFSSGNVTPNHSPGFLDVRSDGGALATVAAGGTGTDANRLQSMVGNFAAQQGGVGQGTFEENHGALTVGSVTTANLGNGVAGNPVAPNPAIIYGTRTGGHGFTNSNGAGAPFTGGALGEAAAGGGHILADSPLTLSMDFITATGMTYDAVETMDMVAPGTDNLTVTNGAHIIAQSGFLKLRAGDSINIANGTVGSAGPVTLEAAFNDSDTFGGISIGTLANSVVGQSTDPNTGTTFTTANLTLNCGSPLIPSVPGSITLGAGAFTGTTVTTAAGTTQMAAASTITSANAGSTITTGALTMSAGGGVGLGTPAISVNTAATSVSATVAPAYGNSGTGDISLNNTGALVLTSISTTNGNFTLTTTGAVTQTGNVLVTGSTTLTAGAGNNITLTNGGNSFVGAVTVVSGNNVSITDGTSLVMAASTISGNLSLAANGTITQTGALAVTGTTTLAANGPSDITLVGANTFTGAVTVTTGRNVSLFDASPLVFGGASVVTGNLIATAAGISEAGGATLSVGGTSLLTAGANNIVLANAGNSLTGAVTVVSGNNVTFNNAVSLLMGNVIAAAALTLTANGSISQTLGSALTVTGTTTLQASAGNDILLPNANQLTGSVTLTPSERNVTLNDTVGLQVAGGWIVSGNLVLTGAGISETGNLTVGGTSTLVSTGAGNNLVLGNGNNLTGAVSATSLGNITINDTLALVSGNMTAGGNLTLTGAGISEAVGATQAVTGTTTLTAGAANNIALGNANSYTGAVAVVSGNNVTLTDTLALVTGGMTVSGNLSLTGAGISQSGPTLVTVAGTSTLTATGGASIVLSNGNTFTGSVTATATGAINVNDVSSLAIGAAGVSSGGAVTLASGGGISGAPATVSVTAASLSATAVGGIALQTQIGTLTLASSTGAGNITLTNNQGAEAVTSVLTANGSVVLTTIDGTMTVADNGGAGPGGPGVFAQGAGANALLATQAGALHAGGNIVLGTVSAASQVELESTGSVTRALPAVPASNNIAGQSLIAVAQGGFGTKANPMQTSVGTVAGRFDQGGFFMTNTNFPGGVTVGTLTTTTGAVIAGIRDTDLSNDAGGPAGVTIASDSPLTVANSIVTSGDISLTAQENPSDAVANDDFLNVLGGVTVQSTAGAVNLSAGDNLLLAPGSSVIAFGSITLAAGVGEFDADAGTATLLGTITPGMGGGPSTINVTASGNILLGAFSGNGGTFTSTGGSILNGIPGQVNIFGNGTWVFNAPNGVLGTDTNPVGFLLDGQSRVIANVGGAMDRVSVDAFGRVGNDGRIFVEDVPPGLILLNDQVDGGGNVETFFQKTSDLNIRIAAEPGVFTWESFFITPALTTPVPPLWHWEASAGTK